MDNQKKYNDESGEVMLESVIVLLLTIMILIAMISLGFLFYQKSMIQTVANETAANIATSYKYTEQSLSHPGISADSLDSLKMFRTSFAVSSLKNTHKDRADDYIDDRIALTNLGINSGDPQIDDIEIIVDNVGRLHVECTISMESEWLFSGALEFFGISDSSIDFTATGRAEIIDITSYASYVHYLKYLGGCTDEYFGEGTTVGSIIDSVKRVVDILNG